MITLLAKLWIKSPQNTSSPAVRQAYGILCGGVGIFLNILLFAGKLFAGLISNSISICADAFNNLSDSGSSLIAMIGFKMSGQKPDPEHPFGHGRIEYIAGLIVSLLILLMSFELIRTSVQKILHPEPTEFNMVILFILIAAILMKVYMFLYNTSIAGKINSSAMKAAAADSLSDSLATALVLAAALVSHFTGIMIDGYCGVLVGLFILYTGIQAAKDTISPLLGQPPAEEFIAAIEEIVLSNNMILGIHDLIVHDYGPGRLMISLHAEVPASGDILELHDAIDIIEHTLQSKLNCSAVIHMDPIMNDNPEVMQLKEEVYRLVRELDGCITMHDFRIVRGPTHTNLIFDVVVPFDFHLSDAEIKTCLGEAVQKLEPNYFTIIEVDKSYG